MTKPVELPQDAPEMLVLKAVSLGPLHGYGILLRIQNISDERLEILQGFFYTAIYRLKRCGWIKGNGESRKTIARAFTRSLLLVTLSSRPRPTDGPTWPRSRRHTR